MLDFRIAVCPPVGALASTKALDSELRATREHARRLTEMYGAHAPDTAAAWDAVEEILAAISHAKANRRDLRDRR
ncbi:MAG: CP12 domain-containing protein [Geitlerinemataceae cyanobacterium]